MNTPLKEFYFQYSIVMEAKKQHQEHLIPSLCESCQENEDDLAQIAILCRPGLPKFMVYLFPSLFISSF